MHPTVLVPITFSVRAIGTLGSCAAAMVSARNDRLMPGAITPPPIIAVGIHQIKGGRGAEIDDDQRPLDSGRAPRRY